MNTTSRSVVGVDGPARAGTAVAPPAVTVGPGAAAGRDTRAGRP
jgi:hypothetical protein